MIRRKNIGSFPLLFPRYLRLSYFLEKKCLRGLWLKKTGQHKRKTFTGDTLYSEWAEGTTIT